jgi:hypothetical protein
VTVVLLESPELGVAFLRFDLFLSAMFEFINQMWLKQNWDGTIQYGGEGGKG